MASLNLNFEVGVPAAGPSDFVNIVLRVPSDRESVEQGLDPLGAVAFKCARGSVLGSRLTEGNLTNRSR